MGDHELLREESDQSSKATLFPVEPWSSSPWERMIGRTPSTHFPIGALLLRDLLEGSLTPESGHGTGLDHA